MAEIITDINTNVTNENWVTVSKHEYGEVGEETHLLRGANKITLCGWEFPKEINLRKDARKERCRQCLALLVGDRELPQHTDLVTPLKPKAKRRTRAVKVDVAPKSAAKIEAAMKKIGDAFTEPDDALSNDEVGQVGLQVARDALTEQLRKEALEIITGRALFEKHQLGGKRSTKPLRKIELDPRDVLLLLGDA